MLPLLFLTLSQASAPAPPAQWYGPATVAFHVTYSGNPYDFEKNDVRVRFLGAKGETEERVAYFDEDEAAWKAVLLAQKPGKYRPVLIRNGKQVDVAASPEFVEVNSPLKPGFIQRDPALKNRFRYEDGTPYMPIGFNLGWQTPGLPDMPDMIRTMGKNGVNWSRIWACTWDGKCPWWPNKDNELEPGSTRLWSGALERWDKIVAASEEAGIAFQFVLFHHGQFSTKVNPNWQDNPWNAKNGGFLQKPADFFTDPEAKKRAKMWLRYAVGRYGSSPSVLSWELFNEVEWVDARYENRWKDVTAWHKEMAEYVKSLDPYHHLVTTSSTFEEPGLFNDVDYYQPHTYPSDVRTAISLHPQPGDKPLFFGEFGPGVLDMKGQRLVVRDGIWAGLLSGQAGAGCFWSWDVVEREKLYDEYAHSSKVLNESGLKEHPSARPVTVKVATPGFADMTFSPGAGWAKATKMAFELSPGHKPEGLGGLPSFFQGPNHRDMFPEPLTFRFKAPKAGSFVLAVAQASKAGAHLKVSLNGKLALEKRYEPAASDHAVEDKLTVAYPAGQNEIKIENVENDWVVIRSFSFSAMDTEATPQALGQVNWLAVRLTAAKDSVVATLSSLGLAAGFYDLQIFNLETGESTTKAVKVSGIDHVEKIAMPSRDALVVFKSRS